MLALATAVALAAAPPVTREEMADAVLDPSLAHAPATEARPLAMRATALSHVVFGYFPSFLGDDFSEVRFELLSHVGYFTGGCTATGEYSQGDWPYDALVNAAHEKGTKVLLVVPCFGAAKIDAILNDAAKRQAFIDAVVAAISQGVPADGVDLDFEGMSAAQLSAYPAFVADLGAAVREVLPNAEISAALPAVDWSNAYDYAALAQVLDHLLIMGYDYHWKGGDPGPVSPLDYGGKWSGYSRDLQWSIDDYLAAIDDPSLHHKVVLALPYYGYDWPSVDFEIPGTKTANATARLYSAAMGLAGNGGTYDPDSQSNYFFYEDAGTKHQLWYDDAATLSMKFALAKERDLGGIGIWALTYDAGRTELWEELAASFAIGSDMPQPVAFPELDGGETERRASCAAGGSASPLASIALLAIALTSGRASRRLRR